MPRLVSGINFLVLFVNLIPVPLSLTHLFMLLPHLLTLLTHRCHNSLSLSLPAQDLPLSQVFPTIDSLPASRLTPRTLLLDCFFSASPILFLASSLLFFLFGSMWQIKLATRQLLVTRKYSLSYCIISCSQSSPPPRLSDVTSRLRSSHTFPKVHTRSKGYCSFIQYGLNYYQHKINET